jgi:predicted nucleotidyltransferase
MDFYHPVQSLIPGASGRLLAALAKVDTELPVSRLADVAGVGRTRASALLSDLAHLGVVSRRQVGPTTLVRLDRENAAGELIAGLSEIRDRVVERLRDLARDINPKPVSLLVFGSFARGTAEASSDIDVLAVRSAAADTDAWAAALTEFSVRAQILTGNAVQILDYDVSDLRHRYSARSEEAGKQFWRSVTDDAITLVGSRLQELMTEDHGTRGQTPQGK